MKLKRTHILGLVITGTIILIFTSLYIFTGPAKLNSWDFSQTGQIGDTIGGITAPLIGLIGAVLVYISFQAQIEANRIQADALANEKESNFIKNQYEKYNLSFEEIKQRLNSVEFIIEQSGRIISDGLFSQPVHVKYTGLNAINEYVLRLENPSRKFGGERYNIYGIELTFLFLIKSIYDLIERVELNLTDKEDKDFILREITLFYNGFLRSFADRIIQCTANPEDSSVELIKLKLSIDKKVDEK